MVSTTDVFVSKVQTCLRNAEICRPKKRRQMSSKDKRKKKKKKKKKNAARTTTAQTALGALVSSVFHTRRRPSSSLLSSLSNTRKECAQILFLSFNWTQCLSFEEFRVSTKESLKVSTPHSLQRRPLITYTGMKKKGMQKSRLNDPYF